MKSYCTKCFSFKCCSDFSIGFNSGTFHRLMLLLGLGVLVYRDKWGEDQLGKGAIRSGGALSASSSWLPDYPVENAILREYTYNILPPP